MILNNTQSLILTGIVIGGLFIAGVFGLLDNFMVIIILALAFMIVVLNLILVLTNKKNPD